MSTLFTDPFVRANENPLSDGGLWTSLNEAVNNPLQLLSNVAQGTVTSNRSSSIVSGVNFSSDQWCQVTLSAFGSTTVPFLLLRASGSGAGTNQAYRFDYDGTSHIRLEKMVNGAFTQLAFIVGTFAVNDVLRFEAQGSTLTGYQNGVAVITATDTSLTTGQPGLGVNPQATLTNATFSNYSAGDFGTSLLLQAKIDALTTVTTHTNAYPKNVTAGSLLVVGIACYNSGFTGTTVTDTQGNSYTVLSPTTAASGGLQLAYAFAKSSGANTVSTTVNVAGANNQIIIAEYQISGPFDVRSQATALTAAFTSNSTVTTAFNKELLIGLFFQRSVLATTLGAAGWNMRVGQPNGTTSCNIALWDQVVSSKAGYTFSGTGASTGTAWVTGIYTFNISLNNNLLMMMGCGT